jgi:hypothetical protein
LFTATRQDKKTTAAAAIKNNQTSWTGLPDDVFSKPKSPIWVNFGVPYVDWKMFTYMFYGHLEYFTGIGDILCSFVTFCVHLVHFVSIWYIFRRFWYRVPKQ